MVILGIESCQPLIFEQSATSHTVRAKPLPQPVDRPFQNFLLGRIAFEQVQLLRAVGCHQVRAAHADAAKRPFPAVIPPKQFHRLPRDRAGQKGGGRQFALALKGIQFIVPDMDRHRPLAVLFAA